MLNKTMLSVVAIAAALSAAPATWAATSDDDNLTVKVRIADIDLNTASGAKAALSRIRSAAVRICGEAPDAWNSTAARQYRSCVDGVVTRTVATLNSPTVTAQFTGASRQASIDATGR